MELRRQLMIFVETEVLPSIVNLARSDDRHFVVEVFEYLCAKGHLHTMDLLAKTMVDPGEQYPSDLKPVLKIADFKEVFNLTAKECAQTLIDTNFSSSQPKQEFLVILLQTIGYYLLDEASVSTLFKLVRSNLKQTELTLLPQCKTQLEIYMALEKWLVSDDDKESQEF